LSKDDVKPLLFRTLDGEPVVPAWLRQAAHKIAPAPFSPNQGEEYEQGDDDGQGEPEPFPQRARRESIAPRTLRRTSLPPRMSIPPQVVITRPPPPPQMEPAPQITPAEQEAYANAALELASLRARLLANTEAQLLELSVMMAEAIIGREIERDPAIHGELARAAVAALGDTRQAKLRASRAAFRAISEVHGEDGIEVDGVRVEMMLDNSLEGLSVIAESGASRVDGRVSERLAAVLRAIEADLRRRGSGDDE
jgi:hypothetical protein